MLTVQGQLTRPLAPCRAAGDDIRTRPQDSQDAQRDLAEHVADAGAGSQSGVAHPTAPLGRAHEELLGPVCDERGPGELVSLCAQRNHRYSLLALLVSAAASRSS